MLLTKTINLITLILAIKIKPPKLKMKRLDPTKVKILLIKRGLRQKDLAKKLGVTESYVSQILKGRRMAAKYREKLMKILEELEKGKKRKR